MTDIVVSAADDAEVARLLAELASPVGRRDPYPRYERLRQISVVQRADDGAFVFTRYADCAAITRDARLAHRPIGSRAFPGYPDWVEHPALRLLFTSLLTRNPPDHTRLRRLVSVRFTTRRVLALRPAITAMVDDLLDRIDGGGDFVDEFAFPLPVNVVGELLGIPEPDRAQFQRLVRDWLLVLETLDDDVLSRANPAAATIRNYLADLAAQRRRRPGDDLLSALTVEEAGDGLTEDELLTTAAFLFAAGFETTSNLLANGLVALLDHPEQRQLLRERPGLAASAVEELLRFDSPVQIISRTATAPLELGGVTVAAGERVVGYVGAGNRDPLRFPAADRLLLDRADNAPLSFGGGIHYCVGAPLARLEAQIAMPALVRRYPRLAQAGEPEYRNSLLIRGYVRMPIATG